MEKLNNLFLSPQVSVFLFVELFLLLILSIALFHTLFILKRHKRNETTNRQYQLEKRSYLVTTAISIALFIKISLLPFFTYTLNDLANIIPGAMCAAGVVWANDYGSPLLLIKISVIILTALWLLLNHEDKRAVNFPYFKGKLRFFIFLYILILSETIIEFIFLAKQSTSTPVMCCSTIFANDNQNDLPFGLSAKLTAVIFYISYIGVMFLAHIRNRLLLSILSVLFVYFSYYAIVYFFGIYIYELPTHKCPFCLLQNEYYYIGYFIFGSLFIGIYYTLSVLFFRFANDKYTKIKIWFTFFVAITSFSFIKYLIINRVFL